jgi:uncharacterized protein (TIGR00645 family)
MNTIKRILAQTIFLGRWLQVPLYLGLIVILGAYAYRFLVELFELVTHVKNLDDSGIMLGVLDLIDVVMIANLLIMVIIAGYETFVSPLHLNNDTDRPEWLDEVNAGSMKVKLALALIGISSIHLLRTFIDPSKQTNYAVMWQVLIHLTLVVSAIAIAYTNFILMKEKVQSKQLD